MENQKAKIFYCKVIISGLLIVFSIIFTITLNCSNVCNGSYSGNNNRWDSKVTFYDNTYSLSLTLENPNITESGGTNEFYGFYIRVDDEIRLISNKNTIDSKLTRVNVYVLKDEALKLELTSYKAIFLQILYIVIFIISGVYLLRVIKKQKTTLD